MKRDYTNAEEILVDTFHTDHSTVNIIALKVQRTPEESKQFNEERHRDLARILVNYLKRKNNI